MSAYDFGAPDEVLAQLTRYYSLLTRWNNRLHLVAPCSPEEFATRHVLESLMLLKFLPEGATVADVGSGGGLPILPCLIARADLKATLIESSQKKAVFLREALNAVGREATVIGKRFEEIEAPPVEFVTCRALDRFPDKVAALLEWAPRGATMLLFGGAELLGNAKKILIPGSQRRFLFIHRAN